MKNKIFLTIIIIFQILYGYANNPPNQRTGAPGQTTCASGNCHNSFSLNSGPAEIEISGPNIYNPGEISTYIISIYHNDMERWGFELCSLNDELNQGGTIIINDEQNTQLSSSDNITYLKQTNPGTFNGQCFIYNL